MIELKLYTTEGCHLCEKAESILNKLVDSGVCQWVSVEISDEDELIERYGVRIPVVVRDGDKEQNDKGELNWPFTLEQMIEWLI